MKRIVYKTWTFFFLCCWFFFPLHAQQLSGSINSYTTITAIDYCTGVLEVTTTAGFEVGMKVIMIQMQGAEISNFNSADFGTVQNMHRTGFYEKNEIEAIAGNTISLRYQLVNSYDVASAAVQLVSMPVYENATVLDTLRAQNWNGSTGGVLAIQVTGALNLEGTITANGAGFRGGRTNQNLVSNCNSITNNDNYFYAITDWRGGGKGEGIAAYLPNQEAGQGPQANGGGGGNDHNTGGGGGGNATNGGSGGQNRNASCMGDYPGLGGKAILNLTNRIFLGGGGGAGHTNESLQSSGGNGGGIIIIEAGTITGSGAITANGLSALPVSSDGGGGGGSGGTIVLNATSLAPTIRISANGGNGGSVDNANNDWCMGPGGGGSGGRILSNNPLVAMLNPGQAGQTFNSASCDGSTNGAENGQLGVLENLANLPQGTLDYGASNEPPLLSCVRATSSSITFEWSHPAAESYKYTYQINGQFPITNLSTIEERFVVGNLQPLDRVTITVQANLVGGCRSPEITVMCSTIVCGDSHESAFAGTAAAYCYDGTPIQLQVNPTGGTFSGTAVTPTGVLIPEIALLGPFTVYYTYQDSLDCMREDSLEITVTEPIERPMVACGTTTNRSITIDWTHPSATLFEVQVRLDTSSIVDTFLVDGFTFTQNNLNPGTIVEFRVKAFGGGACGTSAATATTCQTSSCEEEDITFTNLKAFYCTTEPPSQIQATPPGGTFSGVGIDADGNFSPSEIPFSENEEERRIALTYLLEANAGCPMHSETVFVQILPGLHPPLVACGETQPNSILVNWTHPTATTFNILYGANGAPLTSVRNISADSFRLRDVEPLSRVLFLVEAVGINACGNSMPGSVECFTDDCPRVNVSISGLAEGYCSTDSSVQLSASPMGGQFFGSGVSPTGLFSPESAGEGRHVISYRFTNPANNCIYRDSVVTQVSKPPELEIQGLEAQYCYNEPPVQLTATPPGGTFSGIGVTADGLFSPVLVPTGRAVLTYSYADSIGCEISISDSTEIIVPIPPPVVSCDSVTLSSITFSWSHPSAVEFNYTIRINGEPDVVNFITTDTTYTHQNLQPGDAVTIEVIALEANQCGSNSPVATQSCTTLLCPNNIVVELTPVPNICLDGVNAPIELEATIPDGLLSYTETWHGLGITDTLAGIFDPTSLDIQAGTVFITHTLAIENCKYENQLSIFISESPLVNAGTAALLTCTQSEIRLQGQIQPFFSNYIYNWTTDTGNIVSGADTLTPLVNRGGWYKLTVQNGTCSVADSVLVEENLVRPHADAGTAKMINCGSTMTVLGGDNTSVGAEFQYEWSGPNNFSSSLRNPTVAVAGIYELVVRNIVNQCVSETSRVEVTDGRQPLIADVQVSGILSCLTDTVVLDASASSFGQHLIYEWSDANGFILPNATGTSITVTEPGFYGFVVLDTLTGCGKMTSVNVRDDFRYPIADAGEDKILKCDDLEIVLDGSKSSSGNLYSIVWSNGEVLRNGNTLFPVVGDGGTYILTIQNLLNGCIAVDSVTVKLDENALRAVQMDVETPVCGDHRGQLLVQKVIGGQPPYLYAIDFHPFQAQPLFKELLPGTHKLTVQGSDGCEYDTTIRIQALPLLSLELGDDYAIQLGDSIVIVPDISLPLDSLAELQWYIDGEPFCLNCDTLRLRPLQTTTFALEIIDVNGCTTADELTVVVNRTNLVYIPNVFSPNGDAHNDYFTLFGGAGVEKIQNLRIFNRWGSMLYEQAEILPNDATSGWDGTYNGELMSPDVFIFTAEVTYMDGRTEFLRGELTLLR